MSIPTSPDHSAAEHADPLAHLRHELRTPLNQIIGYSELLQEDAEAEGHTQFVPDLQKIQLAARNLMGVIADNLSGKKASVLLVGAVLAGEDEGIPAPEPAAPSGAPKAIVPFMFGVHDESEKENARLKGGRLLVVDDSEMNRDMLSRRLEKQGCIVTTAVNGVVALEIMRQQPLDLVLLDIMMPELDGYTVLQRMKADTDLRHLPVIMISALDELSGVIRCIEAGAEDFLPKPFNPTLLRARIGACLEKKQLRDQEQKTYAALVESQKHLAAELHEAAEYVKALLPTPLTAGPILTDWRFIPSTTLGGDAFGYHWLDKENLAIYLLDVCGHGVGAALLSISAINVLRAQSLANTDFKIPGQVLLGLNEAFQMETQNNMYFTMWYGVYHAPTRKLTYSSGGHPPSILVPPAGAGAPGRLRTPGLVIGSMTGITFKTAETVVPPGSKLFVFSDGTYELKMASGETMTLDQFIPYLTSDEASGPGGLDYIIKVTRSIQGMDNFEDDFSMMRLDF